MTNQTRYKVPEDWESGGIGGAVYGYDEADSVWLDGDEAASDFVSGMLFALNEQS
jgi:hypothetical protein